MSKELRLIVVGAGGIGGWLCHGLAKILEFGAPGSGLIIVDGDNFEPKNKERQIFQKMGNKAEVLASELTPQYPKTIIIPQPFWVVESVEDSPPVTEEEAEQGAAGKIAASDLICDGDIVYPVVDNFACRKLIMDTAAKLDNIDVITGGNDEELYGNLYHYRRRDGEDVTAHPAEYHDEYENPKDRNPGDLSCQERAEIEGGQQIIGTNMGVASYLLARTYQSILNDDDISEKAEIYFDLGSGYGSPSPRQPAKQPTLTGA